MKKKIQNRYFKVKVGCEIMLVNTVYKYRDIKEMQLAL